LILVNGINSWVFRQNLRCLNIQIKPDILSIDYLPLGLIIKRSLARDRITQR
jgi:hypothetical protein